MLCPICRQPLVIIEFDNVELDACPDCRGLWFDAQELRQLFELTGVPEEFHGLESHLARLPRAKARRFCARCRGKLLPVRAPAPNEELILDACGRGHGLWFDNGELETLFAGLVGEQSEALHRVRTYLGQFASTAEPEIEGEG